MLVIARQMERILPTLLLSQRVNPNQSLQLPFNSVFFAFSNMSNQGLSSKQSAPSLNSEYESIQDSESNRQSDNQNDQLQKHISNPRTVQILRNKGISSLFPIQVETFSAVYEGRDVLASDRTGSGKTIAYSLPVIEQLRNEKIFGSGKKMVKFLVMCPTRELAIQVFKEISSLKHSPSDFKVGVVYGGASMDQQIRELRSGCDIVVATPGRLIDLNKQGHIKFHELRATCIDEADQMLEKGFKLDIEEIFERITEDCPEKTQNLMFSATIPSWVDQISRSFLASNKRRINLISSLEMQTSKTVKHYAVAVKSSGVDEKIRLVNSLIEMYNPHKRTIIFSETKMGVVEIAGKLQKTSALQGDMSQKEREINLNAFRSHRNKILVATDVASRGLDIDDVGMVIQLQPPRNTEPYIHRSGRTGRAGKQGTSITLFSPQNLSLLVDIEREANIEIQNIPYPNEQKIVQMQWESKTQGLVEKIKNMNSDSIKSSELEEVYANLTAGTNAQQIAKKLILALVGEVPTQKSLITNKNGLCTLMVEASSNADFNKTAVLEFIKQKFEAYELQNPYIQTKSILFDIVIKDQNNLQQLLADISKEGEGLTVRKALISDKQMPRLRQLLPKSPRNSRSSSFQQNRGVKTSSSRISRFESGEYDPEIEEGLPVKLFISGLEHGISKEEVGEQFEGMGIDFQNLRIITKADRDSSFGFMEVSESRVVKQLLKKGARVNGKTVRFRIAENK